MRHFLASLHHKAEQSPRFGQFYKNHIEPIWSIWLNRFPPGRGNVSTWLEALILTNLLVLRLFSLSIYLPMRLGPGIVDLYVVLWPVLLAGLLYSCNSSPWYLVLLAGYRVYDILVYEFCVILVDSQKSDWSPISEPRSLILAVFNLLTIAVAFAIAYLWSGQIATPNGHKLSSPAGAFYFSFMTMTTLGDQNFSPTGPWSKSIVVLHLFSSVLYVAVVIPIFVSVVTNTLRRRSRYP
jgi:Ion channel